MLTMAETPLSVCVVWHGGWNPGLWQPRGLCCMTPQASIKLRCPTQQVGHLLREHLSVCFLICQQKGDTRSSGCFEHGRFTHHCPMKSTSRAWWFLPASLSGPYTRNLMALPSLSSAVQLPNPEPSFPGPVLKSHCSGRSSQR